jgi:sodium-dependent dicarboxylate transporter 2/3/5
MLLMLASTVGASFAFMLSVSTPPNAIVFGSRLIPIKTMVRIGAGLNVVASVIVSLYFYLYNLAL